MNSIWNCDVKKPNFESLKSDIKTDVLVIGGGITGILCAYMLKNSGIDCVIAEQNTICSGVTQNTTAKITYQHGAIYDKLIKRFGKETAHLYYKSQYDALCKYKNLYKEIECDFKECSNYIYSLDDKIKIENEVNALCSIGAKAFYHNKTELPFEIAGAVEVKNQAQFNVLKFLYTIAKDLKIYENTKIIELTDNGAKTNKFSIKADKIIVATHFPFVNKYGAYFIKMYQQRSYVIALKNAQNVQGMYLDEAQNGLSFRNYKDLLLLGGGGHRIGKKGGNWETLRKFAKEHYVNATEVYHFATQDCMSLDNIAYIGQYSKSHENIYVATGFNKWGMTTSMSAAMMLADLICDKQNDYLKIFSPSRSIIHPKLFINAAETLRGLITPTAPRCPHLGCALKYNLQEHSWDCSCHGSRFSQDGQLLNNPATDDIKI